MFGRDMGWTEEDVATDGASVGVVPVEGEHVPVDMVYMRSERWRDE